VTRRCEMAGCGGWNAERIDACGSVYLCAPCRKLVEQGAAALRREERRPLAHKEIAARLRALADKQPTYIWRELYALAREIEESAKAAVPLPENGDIEALVRATQPTQRRRRGLFTLLRGRP
jgi:hypothetical protein